MEHTYSFIVNDSFRKKEPDFYVYFSPEPDVLSPEPYLLCVFPGQEPYFHSVSGSVT